jgi:hypothetical protein
VCGRYTYCLAGKQHNSPGEIDLYITCMDLSTGAVVQQRITRAGLLLPNPEPVGMGVYRTVAVVVLRCGTSQSEGPTPNGAGPVTCGVAGRGDRI